MPPEKRKRATKAQIAEIADFLAQKSKENGQQSAQNPETEESSRSEIRQQQQSQPPVTQSDEAHSDINLTREVTASQLSTGKRKDVQQIQPKAKRVKTAHRTEPYDIEQVDNATADPQNQAWTPLQSTGVGSAHCPTPIAYSHDQTRVQSGNATTPTSQQASPTSFAEPPEFGEDYNQTMPQHLQSPSSFEQNRYCLQTDFQYIRDIVYSHDQCLWHVNYYNGGRDALIDKLLIENKQLQDGQKQQKDALKRLERRFEAYLNHQGIEQPEDDQAED